MNSGSFGSFIQPRVVKAFCLKSYRSRVPVRIASASSTVTALGHTTAILLVKGHIYENVRLVVLPICALASSLVKIFKDSKESLTLTYDGELPPLTISGVAVLKLWKITKSLQNAIYQRAKHGKQSQKESPAPLTGDPLSGFFPHPDDIRSQSVRIMDTTSLAKYRFFSRIDLKSAYHQVRLHPQDKPSTAFEAGGGLYQCMRAPFRVTNGVACFQRMIDLFIKDEHLEGTFAYLGGITVCGSTQVGHDKIWKTSLL
ncbi:hypothetical protein M514_23927 [Trichuris suis]|uniref:Reverse transcriptase domain-containing protein n=1 Tax=Trichuris suis TaxID=68888 RepID=A0A085N390_9BILA|nr:hypothetical protein M514_23927 [Trichuris suis]